MGLRGSRPLIVAMLTGGWAALVPVVTFGQAWLPPGGATSFSVQYGDALAKKHYTPDGGEVDVGHTRTHAVGFAAFYSPTDRIMLSASIPYVTTRYYGPSPHPTDVDDSHEHSTFTDLTLAVHYQWLTDPVLMAPYVAVLTPVHDYETLGHAAPGRGLTEVWTGFFVGRSFDAWIPRTYVQARVNYAFVEKVAGLSHDRGNLDLEVGYFLTPAFNVRALAAWQDTYGGIQIPVPRSSSYYPFHDQLGSETYVRVGGGFSWAMSRQLGLYAVYMESVSGTNGHKLDHGLTVGFDFWPRAD